MQPMQISPRSASDYESHLAELAVHPVPRFQGPQEADGARGDPRAQWPLYANYSTNLNDRLNRDRVRLHRTTQSPVAVFP